MTDARAINSESSVAVSGSSDNTNGSASAVGVGLQALPQLASTVSSGVSSGDDKKEQSCDNTADPIDTSVDNSSNGGVSRKRSATEALSANRIRVQFPPFDVADFVIHYRNTDFYVHKFVLFHHSAYFRTFIRELIHGERVYESDDCADDEHPYVTHCIRLPNRCGKRKTSVDDFRLFLCHLYFIPHYSCFPYRVATEIDLSVTPAPAVCLDWPALTTWKQLLKATSSVFFASQTADTYLEVLSLCDYFYCAQLLSRCEDNMLLLVKEDRKPKGKDQKYECRMCLQRASEFSLQRVKEACIPVVAARCCSARKESASKSKAQWERLVQSLDGATLVALLQEVCSLAK